MEDAKRVTMKKVLMLPWLAHGHIAPFLELAKSLSRRNFAVFFCSTPVNLATVKSSLPKYSASINLVEIHLAELPNLPPQYHTTRGLPPNLMNTLKRAFNESGPDQLSDAVDHVSPDLLIYDFLSPWAPAIARARGIPAVLLANVGAGVACFLLHAFKKVGEKFPSEAIYIPVYFLAKVDEKIDEDYDESGHKDSKRALQCFMESQDIILVRTFGELEAKYMDYLSSLSGKMVVPLGPLVQDSITQEDEKGLIGWLDKKEKSSTVFVSFGTEYFLGAKELEEIAHGLELSGVNFIWVIRFPEGEDTLLEDALPNSFLDRVTDRGFVVEKWAAQERILAHPSIGGFVSHCGWNSVMESLKYGVPIMAMPMQLDQPLNARVIDEAGVGVEVRRGTGGRLDRNEIARVVRDVVLEENGEKVRKKVKEISDGIRNRGDEEIEGVISELIKLCEIN